MAKPGLRKGVAKVPGSERKKGGVNKTTALLKDAILQAAEAAGDKEGMVGYLKTQATENPVHSWPCSERYCPCRSLVMSRSLSIYRLTSNEGYMW